MNKRFFTQIVPVLAIAACPVFFTACSDDDEGGSTPKQPVETFQGKLVTRMGDMNMSYDEMGRCYRITDVYSEDVIIDYDEGTITYGGDDPVNVTFNAKGYITSLSASWNWRDEYSDGYETCKGSGKFTFSYDGDGRLVKCASTSSESGEYSEDGEKYKYSEKATSTGVYEWRNGNLVTCDVEYSYNSDGDKGAETHHATIEYDDDGLVNEYGQHTWAIADYGLDINEYMEALSLVGMLGAAPAMLPTAISTVDTETWDLQDGGTDTWEDDVTIDYQFLANGLLNWERWNNRTYYRFGYEEYTPSDETRAARAVAGKADGKKFRVRDLFFGKRARK